MLTDIMQVNVRCYHFTCPECGVGDGELGHRVTHDEVHCLVCLIDDGHYVRLRRWLGEEPFDTTAA